MGCIGCASDSLKPPPADDHALYWRLELNHHAVTLSMAPSYDTLTLSATARNVHGDALAGLPAPTYRSTDVATVRISADGVLQAVAANSQPVWVIATLTVDNLRHVDSALVRVVDLATPPVLASFSVHPLPPDSAKTFVSLGNMRFAVLPVRATDSGDTPFDSLVPGGIPVYFHSSDTTVASVDRVTGEITGRIPGTVTLDASTTAFGVSKVDTLPYRIGWPVHRPVNLTVVTDSGGNRITGFSPSEVTIGTGGMVWWLTSTFDTATVDITFAEADVPKIAAADTWAAAPFFAFFYVFSLADVCVMIQADCASGGNVDLAPPSISAFRVFPVPGTYEYRSTRYGIRGRIIVVDER